MTIIVAIELTDTIVKDAYKNDSFVFVVSNKESLVSFNH